MYKDTAELFAIRFPNVPIDFVEQLNTEMERMEGNMKIKDALFNKFQFLSMDVVKRVLPLKKKQR